MDLLIHSFIHSLTRSFIPSFSHSFIPSFSHSFSHSFIHHACSSIQFSSIQFNANQVKSIQFNSISIQSFIHFLQCIHVNSPLAISPTIPIGKLDPIVMSYLWNFRPGACWALPGIYGLFSWNMCLDIWDTWVIKFILVDWSSDPSHPPVILVVLAISPQSGPPSRGWCTPQLNCPA